MIGNHLLIDVFNHVRQYIYIYALSFKTLS